MKLAAILFFLSGFILGPNLISVRDMYEKAYAESSDASFFYDFMQRQEVNNNALLLGYKGTSYIFMASHGWNPMTKYSNFKTGSELLDQAVELDKESIELRYLRYSVQSKAPSFLNYSKHMTSDRAMIKSKWASTSDMDLKGRIATFMMADEKTSTEEKRIFTDFAQNSALLNRKS